VNKRAKAKDAPPAKPRKRGRPPKRETETPDIPGARIIKRYGNRRLYDHTLSRPVTMDQLAEAVRKGEDIRVLDGETGEDLTRRILVQIILEQGSRNQLELLPVDFLRQLIQLRSDTMAHWMSQYLSAGAEWLSKQMHSSGPAMNAIQQSLDGLMSWMRQEPPIPPDIPASVPPREEAAKVRREERKLADEIGSLQERLADLAKRVHRR
jgi:polyhydroxyalkanoate synthesis repressor PhaR